MQPLFKSDIVISYIAEAALFGGEVPEYSKYEAFRRPQAWRPYALFLAIEEGLTTK